MVNEKRTIDASPDDCIKKTKRKTNFAKIIVSGTADKPYYEIMWLDYMDGQYHIGYGSYNLNFVFQWLAECFEVEDAPTVEVVSCRNCEFCYYNSSSEAYKCMSMNGMYGTVDPDGFCSYGERRNDV